MDKIDRLQTLHQLFKVNRLPISLSRLADELDGCSRSTIERDIDYLRDFLNAPITKSRQGWCYDTKQGKTFELPGLWLTPSELQSLVFIIALLDQLSGGLVDDEITLIRSEIDKLLQLRNIDHKAIAKHFSVLPLGHRTIPGKILSAVATAIVQKKCLQFDYTDYNNKQTRRTISPQTVVYYRDNWYIDAWCHKRKALRTFTLARIHSNWRYSDIPRVTVPQAELDTHFKQGYGIFAGDANNKAVLQFSAAIASDIAAQQWHPEQIGRWLEDSYELSFPYSDDRELIGDILRYIPHVQIIAPQELKTKIKERLSAAIESIV